MSRSPAPFPFRPLAMAIGLAFALQSEAAHAQLRHTAYHGAVRRMLEQHVPEFVHARAAMVVARIC